jgi:hypothetical protein
LSGETPPRRMHPRWAPAVKKSDHGHRQLLRACRKQPRRRAAEECDELAAFHSITASASRRSVGEIVSPSAPAVFRFTTSSNLDGCFRFGVRELVRVEIVLGSANTAIRRACGTKSCRIPGETGHCPDSRRHRLDLRRACRPRWLRRPRTELPRRVRFT